MMSDYAILGWLAIGIVVGIGSKLLLPGRDAGSWPATLLVAVTGAVLDGWSGARLLGPEQAAGLPGWMASLIGAVLLIAVYRFVRRRNLML